MSARVFINRVEKILLNDRVSNDEMEHFLGEINRKYSKTRRLILRNNGIQKHYYALDKQLILVFKKYFLRWMLPELC